MRKFFKKSSSSKMGLWIHRVQLCCVSWLQIQEAKCTLMQKRIILTLFLFLSCGTCVLILLNGLSLRPGISADLLPINSLRTPIIQQSPASALKLNAEDTINVLIFLNLIDSLQLTPAGRKQLEVYFQNRPGMRDSIPLLKNLFIKKQ